MTFSNSEIKSLIDNVMGQLSSIRKAGNQLLYFCPKCNHYKKKLEISVNIDDGKFGIFNCWTCHYSGNLFTLFRDRHTSQSNIDKLYLITKEAGVHRKGTKKISNIDKLSLPKEFIPLSYETKSPEYKNAMLYLKKRGIIKEDIIRYNLGYCQEGEYGFHIIIPSYNLEGSLNFFIGRRYYNVEGSIPYKKPNISTENVIGFESFINYGDELNFCEGVFDGIAIRNNAVPLFGKYISNKLKESIILHGVKSINICFDNDAIKDSVKMYYQLKKLGVEDIRIFIFKEKDPSVMGFKTVHSIIRNSNAMDESDIFKIKLAYNI